MSKKKSRKKERERSEYQYYDAHDDDDKMYDDYNMMTRAGNEATEVAVGSSVRLAVAFPPKNLHIRVTPDHPKVHCSIFLCYLG